jgi:ROS/MUCR transcriptional regulator protein
VLTISEMRTHFFLDDGWRILRLAGVAPMQTTKPPLFRTRRQVERYFGRKTIKCLLCGRRFGRLSFHLAAKHGVTTDDYKRRFGLPWHRGLTSAVSHTNSGWNDARKAKASKLAQRSRFFKFARAAPRRAMAPFLKVEAARHLAANAAGFGREFESRVRVLFERGLTDAAIAQVLNVNRMTVNRRTKRWRKPKRRK